MAIHHSSHRNLHGLREGVQSPVDGSHQNQGRTDEPSGAVRPAQMWAPRSLRKVSKIEHTGGFSAVIWASDKRDTLPPVRRALSPHIFFITCGRYRQQLKAGRALQRQSNRAGGMKRSLPPSEGQWKSLCPVARLFYLGMCDTVQSGNDK